MLSRCVQGLQLSQASGAALVTSPCTGHRRLAFRRPAPCARTPREHSRHPHARGCTRTARRKHVCKKCPLLGAIVRGEAKTKRNSDGALKTCRPGLSPHCRHKTGPAQQTQPQQAVRRRSVYRRQLAQPRPSAARAARLPPTRTALSSALTPRASCQASHGLQQPASAPALPSTTKERADTSPAPLCHRPLPQRPAGPATRYVPPRSNPQGRGTGTRAVAVHGCETHAAAACAPGRGALLTGSRTPALGVAATRPDVPPGPPPSLPGPLCIGNGPHATHGSARTAPLERLEDVALLALRGGSPRAKGVAANLCCARRRLHTRKAPHARQHGSSCLDNPHCPSRPQSCPVCTPLELKSLKPPPLRRTDIYFLLSSLFKAPELTCSTRCRNAAAISSAFSYTSWGSRSMSPGGSAAQRNTAR